ncbi:adenylyl-sulfate kinase [Fervidibacillus albus]|uniref:adenylyl-sulfate kinase n=1 Tax=Fervidibacillus albus TaxID=2980026 RepID=UPI0023B31572|nr:adenylyl-sulfate kinase [Fervidibacillus albus]
MTKSKNLFWHPSLVTKKDRWEGNGHKSCVLWFTGLSGSGKSTLANAVDFELYKIGCQSYVLDGDNVRHGLNRDLGFLPEDRRENIRRVGEVAKLFVDSGIIVSTAFISPFKQDRQFVRTLFSDGEFIEIFVDCPLEICEKRDPKGLYKWARNGEIANFTGIDAPFERPNNPDIHIDSSKKSIENAVHTIIHHLKERKIIK